MRYVYFIATEIRSPFDKEASLPAVELRSVFSEISIIMRIQHVSSLGFLCAVFW